MRERKRDEGFTAAVMFVGSRNFGVSESGEESYLNEPGRILTVVFGPGGVGGREEGRSGEGHGP